MTTDQTPPSPQPGPDAGIDDVQNDIEHTREELGETVEALSANADVEGQAKEKVSGTKDRITEKAYKTKDAAVEKAHAAQSTAREAFIGITGLVKPGVPIAALIAAAVVIGAVVWRRR